MPVDIVIGMQYGDEGKGKAVDFLSTKADLTVRFQGGDNAGHTIINEYGVSKLHLIPCGITNPQAKCLIASGVVVNLDVLSEEIAELQAKGINCSNLFIDRKAHLITPFHILLDEAFESGAGAIGTTKRGIGQAYAFKHLRKSLRVGDLLHPELWQEKLDEILPLTNAWLRHFGHEAVTAELMLAKLSAWKSAFETRIVDGSRLIQDAVRSGQTVLMEGQLGTMKDIDHGIYPYVTSSSVGVGAAIQSGGFSHKDIRTIFGVAKLFTSAVGAGPLPGEFEADEAAILRGTGEHADDEFGARTGRSRRLAHLDLVVLNYAAKLNGIDRLILTKLDKLDSLAEIQVCVAYELDGQRMEAMPDTESLYRVNPIMQRFKGWNCDTSSIRSFADLPEEAKVYLNFLETAVACPIAYIGNGPARDQLILGRTD